MPAFPTSTTVLDSILFRDAFGTPPCARCFPISPDLALRRGRGRAGEGRGALRRDSGRGGRGDRPRTDVAALDFDLLRQRDRHRRLSDPAAGAPAGEAVRRGRPLRALGRHHAGHHGYRRRAAGPRRARDHRGRHRGAARHPRRSRRKRYRDTPMAGRTHLQQALPVTFGYKTAIWLAMFDRHAERLRAIEAARAGRPVRRRRRHAGLARRQGFRGAAGAVRGTRPRRARLDLACRARRLCRGRQLARRWSPARSARSRSTS